MHAAWYSSFGAADNVLEVGELPTPVPADGEVLIRVRTSGVNPVDVKRRAGGRGAIPARRVVPHFDGAGVIEAVGAGVSPERVGQRVWIYEAQWNREVGTAASTVCLPARLAVPLPRNSSFQDGASLGIPALTAWQCVFGDGPVDGRTILVTGGAGAVGSYAIQFAALAGARVLTTVSTEEKAEFARRCGADEVVRYREESVSARVLELTDGAGVDRVVDVDFGANLSASVEVLKPRGVIAAYASAAAPEPPVPFYAMLYRNVTTRFELVFLMTDTAKAAAVRDLNAWLTAERLIHPPVHAFALDEIVAAHEAVEGGAFGKVMLEIDS
jgi:NADPH2:quinone reductase